MLELRKISKTYKSREGSETAALKDINLDLGNSGMVFLTGDSGSGKTTLLNILGGMDRPDRGELLIDGSPAKGFGRADFNSYRNSCVGFVFQDFCLLEEYTVADNIGLALSMQGMEKETEKIDSILKKVELEGFGARYPAEMSGGQKQRTSIARALVKDPWIILADEPTGNLDSVTGAGIFALLKELSGERLVVVVSHDREAAIKYADRIVTLKDGAVISDEANGGEIPADCLTVTPEGVYLPRRKLNEKELITLQAELDSNKIILKRSYAGAITESVEKANLVLKKCKLPIKTAIRLGAAGIKLKPRKFITIAVVMVLAFTIFGADLSMLLGGFGDMAASVLGAAEENRIIIEQGKRYEQEFYSEMSSSQEPLPDGAYEEFAAEYSQYFSAPVYRINSVYYRYSISSTKNIYGMLPISLEKLEDWGYSLLYGEYPHSGEASIAITDFVADGLISYTQHFSGNEKTYSSYDEILSEGIAYNDDYTYHITGILDTGYKEKYAEAIESGYNQDVWNTRELDYEAEIFYSMLYTADIASADAITDELNQLCHKQAVYSKIFDNSNIIDIYSFSNYKEAIGDILEAEMGEFIYKDTGVDFEDVILADNEIIIDNSVNMHITGDFSVNLPYTVEINGVELTAVGYVNNLHDLLGGNYILVSDAAYNNPLFNLSPVESIYAELGFSDTLNAAMLNELDSKDYYIETFYSDEMYTMLMVIGVIRYFVLGAAIFLAAYAALMLFNFINMTVSSKSRDIGILRAIGAGGKDIAFIYLVSALAVAVAAAILAIPDTFALLAVLNNAFTIMLVDKTVPTIFFFGINLRAVLLILALSVTVAAAAAIIPVIRLARMAPVDAIKKI